METLSAGNAILLPERTLTVGELGEEGRRLYAELEPAKPVAFVGERTADLLSAVVWLHAVQGEGLVLPRERLTSSVTGLIESGGFGIADAATGATLRPAARAAAPGTVHLLTSGTTGTPKLVRHSWDSLFTMRKVQRLAPSRWLLTYLDGTYAWYQLVTLILFVPGQSLVVAERLEPSALVKAAAANNVTAISATPTFWRIALIEAGAEALARLPLRQCTLGGELVDQAILDTLSRLYPRAEIVHIFAATEVGAAIVVRDGRAGFPAAWLNDERRVPALTIRDGRLWIRSPYAARGREGWTDTGDLVEVRGDRVHFLGRAERGVFNVGGAKAFAADIEAVVLSHPAVAWCQADSRRSPITGEMVTCTVVPRHPDADHAALEAELESHCRAHLPEPMVPRLWKFLSSVPTTEALKTPLFR